MPRTRNITRQQWEAAAEPVAGAGAATIRSWSSGLRQRDTSTSIFAHPTDHWSTLSVGSSKENYGPGEDENTGGDENAPPPSVRQGKGKGKEKASVEGTKRKKQPLQDITDIVVSKGNQPNGNNPKRRRRLRTRTTTTTTHPSRQPLAPLELPSTAKQMPVHKSRFPSSLPPSSPPPPASFEQSTSVAAASTSNARNRGAVWESILSQEQEDLPIASDDASPSNNSDPFGFLAVEKELKAERNAHPSWSKGLTREAGGLVLIPATSPLRLDLSVIANEDGEEEMISPCATPPTPHKKKQRWRVDVVDEGQDQENMPPSPRTESLPSSPSPLKVRESWVKEYTLQDRSDFIRSTTGHSEDPPVEAEAETQEKEEGGESDEGSETATEVPRRVLRSRAKGKHPEEAVPVTRNKRKGGREEKSKTPSDPMEFAKKLVERLPKRRKRKGKEREESDEESEPPRAARRRRTQPKKAKIEKPAEPKKQISKERQAIRDYFKELDGYSLEKEKVYVI